MKAMIRICTPQIEQVSGKALFTQGPVMRAHFEAVALPHAAFDIPGATHFYPRNSAVTRPDGSRTTLEDAMVEFLHAALRLDTVA